MSLKIAPKGYTFDDVLLKPKFSFIRSRSEVDISTSIGKCQLNVPIISANMDSCTELEMAMRMEAHGGMGILHRFMPLKEQVRQVNDFFASVVDLPVQNSGNMPRKYLKNGNIGVSIGANEEDIKALHTWLQTDRAEYSLTKLPGLITIDIAHGSSHHVGQMISEFHSIVKKYHISEVYRPSLVVGNIATGEAAIKLLDYGDVDVFKVGVGPGSMCTTRIVTGCGVPQLTAISDVRDSLISSGYDQTSIIADGGIKYAGDITKALAAGANAVMIGGLFAGTEATPGRVITSHGKKYKVYRGMASKDAQVNRNPSINHEEIVPEGEGRFVEVGPSLSTVMKQLCGGLKSGMSYCGASNIQALQYFAEFIPMSSSGMSESRPHGLYS